MRPSLTAIPLLALAVTLSLDAAAVSNRATASTGNDVMPPWRVFRPDEVAPGTSPDRRIGTLRTLDTHCPFTPPASADTWRLRADALRRQIRVALGLWPWPARTPLNARVTGTLDRGDYVVDRVVLESVPGHFVTGNVYRPAHASSRLPAVLTPHGHWPDGRFETKPDDDVAKTLRTGAEADRAAAQHPMQARAVHLARLGVVTYLYDMEGYADSVQIPEKVAHGYKEHRPEMEGRMGYGFFSAQAELHLVSVMGQQAWNAIRALDYLVSRDDVDPQRIGVTGESGGGTETMMLGALDERPRALFPAVMVSTRMQGGCTCENASYLRIGTGNVEIAALAAPRPLGMTAADDWTRTLQEDGYPELQALYDTLGVPGNVMLRSFLQFPHNYNHPARQEMYRWFNTHLHLGFDTVPDERPFVSLRRDEASVWNGHPPSDHGDAHERRLVAWWVNQGSEGVAAAAPHDTASLDGFKRSVGGAWEVLLGGRLGTDETISFDVRETIRRSWATTTLGVIRRERTGAALPTVVLSPPTGSSRGIIVWVEPEGKDALLDRSGPAVRRALAAGYEVLGVDVLNEGELNLDDRPFSRVPLAGTRPHAGYTFGYNLPMPAERTQDVLTALRVARERVGKNGRVLLFATHRASVWAAGARALSADRIDRAAYAVDGFRLGDVTRIDDPEFLPGGSKYGDVPGLVAVSVPSETAVFDSADRMADYGWARDAYGAAHATDAVDIRAATGAQGDAALDWLLR